MTESLEQIRFVELLEDKTFKEFLTTKPQMPPVTMANGRKPWRVYVQREAHGKWAKKDFVGYGEAFNFMRQHLKTAHDVALHCRSVSWRCPGRWVKLTHNGKPAWLRDANGKVVTRSGKKVRKTRYVEIKAPPGHEWCMYCRRFTVFTWFSKHHAFPKELMIDSSKTRCTICGITSAGPNDWKGTIQ